VTSSGGCLCGAVRFEVHGQLRGVLVCHCVECRRWSGQAWAATAARRDELVLLDERSLRWVASPASDARALRGFCGECGSCLFWDAPDRETISIAAGSLDSPEGLEIVGHVYAEQAAAYKVIPDGIARHAGRPS
jgi:hypothetical protein